MTHQHQVGARVTYHPPAGKDRYLAGTYTVLRQLPAENGQLSYHIRADLDGHVRVAFEKELSTT
jgi:hypothetical protein